MSRVVIAAQSYVILSHDKVAGQQTVSYPIRIDQGVPALFWNKYKPAIIRVLQHDIIILFVSCLLVIKFGDDNV